MSEDKQPQYLIQASYKGNVVTVWPIETYTEGKPTGNYVFDFIVNDGYWGTVFTIEEVEKTLTTLRTMIEKGEKIWDI